MQWKMTKEEKGLGIAIMDRIKKAAYRYRKQVHVGTAFTA